MIAVALYNIAGSHWPTATGLEMSFLYVEPQSLEDQCYIPKWVRCDWDVHQTGTDHLNQTLMPALIPDACS